MKYYPTAYKHNTNYSNVQSLTGVDLHQSYEVVLGARRGRVSSIDLTTRIFVLEKPPYKVGDVIVGTLPELIGLFPSRVTLNQYTRHAALKGSVQATPEPQENVVIEDSLQPNLEPDNSSQKSYVYRGISIDFKPVVNGVVFASIEEAEKAIDIALQLKL